MPEVSELYPPVTLNRPPLRVGLILDSLDVPSWVHKTVQDVCGSKFATVALVIQNPPHIRETGFGIYRFYERRDQKRVGKAMGPFEAKDLSLVLKNVPRLVIPTDASIEPLPELDVLLNFGTESAPSWLLNVPRFGIWSIDQACEPCCIWEMIERNPVMAVTLQSSGPAGSVVICRSYGGTRSSLAANRHATFWKASSFVLRGLRRLYVDGAIGTEEPIAPADRHREPPSNGRMLSFLLKNALASASGIVTGFFKRSEWFLTYRPRNRETEGDVPTKDGLRPIYPDRSRFFADPFLISKEGKDYLFFEDLPYSKGYGDISYLEFSEKGEPGEPKPALELGHHLSYPFVFHWEGDYYMVPESHVTGTVPIYKASSFPDQWVFERDLLSGVKAVDATLVEHNGYWYMFANISESGGDLDDELFLFWSFSPLGPWYPHAKNPIKSDFQCARPAGAVYSRKGKLIRPAQDSSIRYGRAITFFEITALSPEEFSDSAVGRLEADWAPGLLCCHHYHSNDKWEVVDARRNVFLPHNVAYQLNKIVRRFRR